MVWMDAAYSGPALSGNTNWDHCSNCGSVLQQLACVTLASKAATPTALGEACGLLLQVAELSAESTR